MAQVIATSEQNTNLRRQFFETAFGDTEGYLAVAYKTKGGGFHEAYFEWPAQVDRLLAWIDTNIANRDLYFCPHLFVKPKRSKGNAKVCPTLWSDLDEVVISKVNPTPSIILTTSEGRYQGLWIMRSPVDPTTGEDLSRRLAHANKADLSGWDLTQLLRIPITYNVKYNPAEIVKAKITDNQYDLADFDEFPEPEQFLALQEEFPEASIRGMDPDEILHRFRTRLVPTVFSLYTDAPPKDWSKALWSLECILAEAGMTSEEIFVVSKASAVNKYDRDNRGDVDLWREVVKAKASVAARTYEDKPPVRLHESLLTEEERTIVANLPDTFVDRYVSWARARTDAAWQYHQAGALIILSTLLADRVHLETSFGAMNPNLWFMLLGDTTLTRKTTAMEMAMGILRDVYDDSVLATDGSIEGILTALGQREGKASLFWRDEFSGMLEAMTKRDYYSGMMEALTKLYDGKYLKRVLRRETIEIRDPVFIMFCGGIRSRILELFNQSFILSGFIPRFVFVSAEADMTAFRPLGPALNGSVETANPMFDEASRIYNAYKRKEYKKVGKQLVVTPGEGHPANLTPEAWARYNVLEQTLVSAGVSSEAPDTYTPTLDRLSKSALKAAVLIAASRQEPPVTVEEDDVLRAIALTERWLPHSIGVVQHAGKSVSERSIERAFAMILRGKDSRAAIMRTMHLSSRDTDLILDTLEQRGMVTRTKYGRGAEKLFPNTTKVGQT